MFWKFGFNTPSALDGILARDDFTLEELLDNEDILTECKNENAKLIGFLCKEEQIARMMQYITEEPAGDDMDKEKYKYPNVACEVLTADVWSILDAIAKPEHMDTLFSVLNLPAPIHPLLASFFMRASSSLLDKKSIDTVTYVQQRPDILEKLIRHMATPAIMDVMMRLCSVDVAQEDVTIQQWLVDEQHLVRSLVDQFDPERKTSREVLCNASTLLSDLLLEARRDTKEMQQYATMCPFLVDLLRGDNIKALLGYIMTPGEDDRLPSFGIQFLLTIINELPRGEDEPPPSEEEVAKHKAEIAPVLSIVAPYLGSLHAMLQPPPEGSGRRGVGALRVSVARLLDALLATDNEAVSAQIVELGTLDSCLDLFFEFPNNNFLQNHVRDCLFTILSLDNDKPLYPHLFKECTLMQRIIAGWARSEEHRAGRKGCALGYMGHLTHLAKVVDVQTKTKLADLVTPDDLAKWEAFKAESLAPTLQLHETVLGGTRPKNYYDSDDDDDFFQPAASDADTAEAAFQRFLAQRVSGDFPDNFSLDEDEEEPTALVEPFGTKDPFSDEVEYLTGAPDWLQEQEGEDEWQILDGKAEKANDMMTSDDWDVSFGLETQGGEASKAAVPEIHAQDEDGESLDGSYDFTAASPSSSPLKTVHVPLSPQGAAAVASVPTQDPFVADESEDGERADSGWAAFPEAAFSGAPQAMDINDAEYNAKLDAELAAADKELATEASAAEEKDGEEEDDANSSGNGGLDASGDFEVAMSGMPDLEESLAAGEGVEAMASPNRGPLPPIPGVLSDADLLSAEDEEAETSTDKIAVEATTTDDSSA